MRLYCRYTCIALAGAILIADVGATAGDKAQPRTLAVVVHKSSAVENLSAADLRKMLTGELNRWPNESAVVVVEQPAESATQQSALQMILRTTTAGYNRKLLQMQFQGKSAPTIKVLNSDETAIKFVWNVPGAISVVDASAAQAATAHVNILRIDGKLPGEGGYLLQ
jgi:ABC-type phosphate transport system substrate-binding protein